MGLEMALSKMLAPYGLTVGHMSLVLLIIQNTTSILVMHESRVQLVGGKQYVASTAVLLSELIKLAVSLTGEFTSIRRSKPSLSLPAVITQLFWTIFSPDCWKLMMPAILFTFQTSLLYIATSNLDAATFQVTYQLKILTTVFFSVCLMGRKLSSRQWLSLILLTIGIAIVQLPESFSITDISAIFAAPLEARSTIPAASLEHPLMSPMKGLAAVIGASLTSGLVGVYMEKVVKDSLFSISLWTRNAQLSFFSFFPAFFIGVLWQDGSRISKDGFFTGYSHLVWASIFLQAFGGLMVSVCITYTDNIAKNFATTVSIILSTLVGAVVFHYIPTKAFVLGASIVLVAIYLYNGHARQVSPTMSLPIHRDYDRAKASSLRISTKEIENDTESGATSDDEYGMSPIDLSIHKDMRDLKV